MTRCLHLQHFAAGPKGGKPFFTLNHEIKGGEILTLMGPSGSGKSTALKALAGFLSNDFHVTGSAHLEGEDLLRKPAHKRRLGFMFQDPMLLPHLSVGENLAFALKARKNRKAALSEALERIDMAGFEARDPASLSGGQKARVALQRMLLSKPKALLLDEPFSSLDTELRADMRSLVFETAKANALPTLLVTHDKEDAKAAEAFGGHLYRL